MSDTSFLEELKIQIPSQNPKKSLFDQLRWSAWQHFEKRGLPERKDPHYRHLTLSGLWASAPSTAPQESFDLSSFKSHIYPECQDNFILFLNGEFRPEHSKLSLPAGARLLSLKEAMPIYGAFLVQRWQQQCAEESDPLALLNGALASEGALLYLPPGVRVDAPLQLLFLSTESAASKTTLSAPRFQLFASQESQIRLALSEVHTSAALCTSSLLDFALEARAQVDLEQITQGHAASWHFSALRATLKEESRLTAVQLHHGAGVFKQDVHCLLEGASAEASLYGTWNLEHNQQTHLRALMEHKAPQTRSLQKVKAIVQDRGRSSFAGKIYVHSNALHTEAYQLSNHLILSERGSAYTQPHLEIFADDVKATHGATVGQLDKELLFYMRARGISLEESEKILLRGFIQEQIDHFTIASAHALGAQLMRSLHG